MGECFKRLRNFKIVLGIKFIECECAKRGYERRSCLFCERECLKLRFSKLGKVYLLFNFKLKPKNVIKMRDCCQQSVGKAPFR